MPIKVFAAPGDHRDDFESVESQFNEWEANQKPEVRSIQSTVCPLNTSRELGNFMLVLTVHYHRGND